MPYLKKLTPHIKIPTPQSPRMRMDTYDWVKSGRDVAVLLAMFTLYYCVTSLVPRLESADVIKPWFLDFIKMTLLPVSSIAVWRLVRNNVGKPSEDNEEKTK